MHANLKTNLEKLRNNHYSQVGRRRTIVAASILCCQVKRKSALPCLHHCCHATGRAHGFTRTRLSTLRVNKTHTSSIIATMSSGVMQPITRCHETAHEHRGGEVNIWVLLSIIFFPIFPTSSLLLWVVNQFIRPQSCFSVQ